MIFLFLNQNFELLRGDPILLKSLVHFNNFPSSGSVRALLQLLSLTIFAPAQSPPTDSLTDRQWQFQDFRGYIEQFPKLPTLAKGCCSICELSQLYNCVCLWCGDRGDVWPHRPHLKLRSLEKCATLPYPHFPDFIPVKTSNFQSYTSKFYTNMRKVHRFLGSLY